MILIDSNVWIGYHHVDDSLHEQSKQILTALDKQKRKILVSNFIVQETFTVLTLKKELRSALIFYEVMTENKKIYSLDVDKFWLDELIEYIQGKKLQAKLSLTDYSNIFLALQFGAELISFNKQLMTLYKKLQAAKAL